LFKYNTNYISTYPYKLVLEKYLTVAYLEASMTTEANKKVVLRFNRDFLERGDSSVLKDLIADNFHNHTAPMNAAADVEGLKQYIGVLRKAFPDMKVEIHQQVAENDMVCTMKTIHATHLGEIMGRPATGKKIAINIIEMVRIENGKYVEHWGRNDLMQVVQQL
jgi:predicted ester cyclase